MAFVLLPSSEACIPKSFWIFDNYDNLKKDAWMCFKRDCSPAVKVKAKFGYLLLFENLY